MLQGWRHKVVTILLYHDCIMTCWNNLATSLITSTRLLQVVNRLSHTCWQLGTSSANTTCWRLVGRLATRCEIFTCVSRLKKWTFSIFSFVGICTNVEEASCSVSSYHAPVFALSYWTHTLYRHTTDRVHRRLKLLQCENDRTKDSPQSFG
jgi:hypothetical protein